MNSFIYREKNYVLNSCYLAHVNFDPAVGEIFPAATHIHAGVELLGGGVHDPAAPGSRRTRGQRCRGPHGRLRRVTGQRSQVLTLSITVSSNCKVLSNLNYSLQNRPVWYNRCCILYIYKKY